MVKRRGDKKWGHIAALQTESLVVGRLAFDPPAGLLFVRGKPVQLHPREADLMAVLMGRPSHPFSTNDLLEQVWGDYEGTTRRKWGDSSVPLASEALVPTTVYNIRQKVGRDVILYRQPWGWYVPRDYGEGR